MSRIKPEEVDKYLQSDLRFAKSWFLENVGKLGLEQWLGHQSSSSPDSISSSAAAAGAANLTVTPSEEGGSSSSPEQPNGNNAHTPVAARNSITMNLFHDIVGGKRKTQPFVKRSRQELQRMNEKDLFMELIRDIANELDVDNLCHKILLNVGILTKSDRGSLFLARGSPERRYLVSKLFDVTENSSLEDSLHNDEKRQIRVPFGKGIAGTVALSRQPINITNAYEDPRFNKDVDKLTGYHTRSLLCMPILSYEGEVIGVAQIMNKNSASGLEVFTKEDEGVFRDYLTFCGIGLTNAQLFEMSVLEYKRNQMLLKLARSIFEEQANLDSLVQKIMREAQEFVQCYQCSVYLLEERTEDNDATQFFNQTFTNFLKKHQKLSLFNKGGKFPRLPGLKVVEESDDKGSKRCVTFFKVFELCQGQVTTPEIAKIQNSIRGEISKEVATTGELMNIEDTSNHSKFSNGQTDFDGMLLNNLLCMPIKNIESQIIGVILLVNKISGKSFSASDVNLVEAFAIFYGLGIHNCQMYESACKLMAKQSVALEVLSYHATSSAEDVAKLKNSVIPSAREYRLYTFDFSDFPLSDDETCKASVRMFMELKVCELFRVPYDVLCRWVLSVKKNYRHVTYHNWRHAFNVAQTMFTMLFAGNMAKKMTFLEMFSLIVACLCHDLDHRGTNNAFQSKAESPLAQLYSTSTMEHHHFDQCVMILNSEGNNLFMNLPPEEYRSALKIVENAILSTDLALYFKKKGQFLELVEKGEKDWAEGGKRDLLRGMMMTACDVSAITKPWKVQQKVAELVTAEFFEQGDLERDKLHQEPIAMMDRKKKDELPKMQVGFIDAICMPVYKTFATLDPALKPFQDGCTTNRDNWQRLVEQYEIRKSLTTVSAEKAQTTETQKKTATPPPSTKKKKVPTATLR